MKKLIAMLWLCIAVAVPVQAQFPTNSTSSTVNIASLKPDWNDFTWTWRGWDDQTVALSFSNGTAQLMITNYYSAFKITMADTLYVWRDSGVTSNNTIAMLTNTMRFIVSHTNIPPNGVYHGEVLLYNPANTSVTRSLARGTIKILESTYANTNMDDYPWPEVTIAYTTNEPVFLASVAYSITAGDTQRWNNTAAAGMTNIVAGWGLEGFGNAVIQTGRVSDVLSNEFVRMSNAIVSSSDAASAASNIAVSASNTAWAVSNHAENAYQTAVVASNWAVAASNYAVTVSNLAASATNWTVAVSNYAVTVSNLAAKATNWTVAVSNYAVIVSNLAASATNHALVASNVATWSSNYVIDVEAGVLALSNSMDVSCASGSTAFLWGDHNLMGYLMERGSNTFREIWSGNPGGLLGSESVSNGTFTNTTAYWAQSNADVFNERARFYWPGATGSITASNIWGWVTGKTYAVVWTQAVAGSETALDLEVQFGGSTVRVRTVTNSWFTNYMTYKTTQLLQFVISNNTDLVFLDHVSVKEMQDGDISIADNLYLGNWAYGPWPSNVDARITAISNLLTIAEYVSAPGGLVVTQGTIGVANSTQEVYMVATAAVAQLLIGNQSNAIAGLQSTQAVALATAVYGSNLAIAASATAATAIAWAQAASNEAAYARVSGVASGVVPAVTGALAALKWSAATNADYAAQANSASGVVSAVSSAVAALWSYHPAISNANLDGKVITNLVGISGNGAASVTFKWLTSSGELFDLEADGTHFSMPVWLGPGASFLNLGGVNYITNGTYYGNGAGLTNLPASGATGIVFESGGLASTSLLGSATVLTNAEVGLLGATNNWTGDTNYFTGGLRAGQLNSTNATATNTLVGALHIAGGAASRLMVGTTTVSASASNRINSVQCDFAYFPNNTLIGSGQGFYNGQASYFLLANAQDTAGSLRGYNTTAMTTNGVNFRLTRTYNQAAASASWGTDLEIARTETSVGTGAQRFADFLVGGVSKFSVSSAGLVSNLNSHVSGTNFLRYVDTTNWVGMWCTNAQFYCVTSMSNGVPYTLTNSFW